MYVHFLSAILTYEVVCVCMHVQYEFIVLQTDNLYSLYKWSSEHKADMVIPDLNGRIWRQLYTRVK